MDTQRIPSVDFLRDEFERRRRINPRYSQRSFAKHLGLAAGELSEVFSGKRKMTLKMGLRVAETLGMSALETRNFLALVQKDDLGDGKAGAAGRIEGASLKFESMDSDVFHTISDWYCFAILNLAETKGFHWTPPWIATRLGIHVSDVHSAIQRLLRVGYLYLEHGRLYTSKEGIEWTGGIPAEAVRNFHRAQLNRAIEALEFQDVSERDISGIGFAVDPEDLPKIKKEISQFQDELVERFAKSKNRREVYQLEMALFRVSIPEVKKGKEK